jgi:hypothetical protein
MTKIPNPYHNQKCISRHKYSDVITCKNLSYYISIVEYVELIRIFNINKHAIVINGNNADLRTSNARLSGELVDVRKND